jgi:hypothetical protein
MRTLTPTATILFAYLAIVINFILMVALCFHDASGWLCFFIGLAIPVLCLAAGFMLGGKFKEWVNEAVTEPKTVEPEVLLVFPALDVYA